MSRLLICGFGPFPEAPENPAAWTVDRLRLDRWAPPDCAVGYAVLPTTWQGAAEAALEATRTFSADAILLVGVAISAEAFRVETFGRNRAGRDRPDAQGLCWPGAVIETDGPTARRVIAPVQAMLAAIKDQGLQANLSSDAGDYLCNFTLYRLLAKVAMTAFLHVPAPSAQIQLEDILAAVRAAATAFARELR